MRAQPRVVDPLVRSGYDVSILSIFPSPSLSAAVVVVAMVAASSARVAMGRKVGPCASASTAAAAGAGAIVPASTCAALEMLALMRLTTLKAHLLAAMLVKVLISIVM